MHLGGSAGAQPGGVVGNARKVSVGAMSVLVASALAIALGIALPSLLTVAGRILVSARGTGARGNVQSARRAGVRPSP
ncbi:MAG TPA: hypothetical protein VGC92_08910, partial [Phenylobacterium sp.]